MWNDKFIKQFFVEYIINKYKLVPLEIISL